LSDGEKAAYQAAKTAYYARFAAMIFSIQDGFTMYDDNWFEWDPNTTQSAILESIIDGNAAPASVGINGYMYVGDENGVAGLKEIDYSASAWGSEMVLEEINFPAYTPKEDFVSKWSTIMSGSTGFSDFWTGATGNSAVTATSLFDTISTKYISADKYPLSNSTYALRLYAQAVEVDPTNESTSAKDHFTGDGIDFSASDK
jgi:hypothetical protein